MDIAIYSLQVEHAPTPGWTLLAGFDYLSVEDQLDVLEENTRRHGTGDLVLQARHAFTFLPGPPISLGEPHVHGPDPHDEPSDSLLWIVTCGVSAPTGKVREPENEGGISSSTLSRGTGTWDPVAGLTLAVPDGPNRWFASVSARHPGGDNRHDYQTGGVRQFTLGAYVPLAGRDAGTGEEKGGRFRAVFAASPRLQLVHRDADELDGHNVESSGGGKLYAAPGFHWKLSRHMELEASLRFTLWRDLDSTQLDSRQAIQTGITHLF